jgi:hypothetical protein
VASDVRRAVTDSDRKLGLLLETARVCVLENLGGRDGHNAAALLGRLIATHGGSASFVATELDVLQTSLSTPEWASMRAALFEGYVLTLAEQSVAVKDATWEPPACVVMLGDGRAAIAGGFPNDAPEALMAWADRVASWSLRNKLKRVVLSGPLQVRKTLAEALSLVGIEHEEAMISTSRLGYDDPP